MISQFNITKKDKELSNNDIPINYSIIEERNKSISKNTAKAKINIACDSDSVAGTVSQRACVYCGARVVLNPITDAYHIVHGPIGCASYTWDIRGSLSSDSEIYRNSFSTDIQEKDVIFGGEKKLEAAIAEIIENNKTKPPKLIFVYATCIIGVIGDDIEAVCKRAEAQYNIRVIPVKSPGFAGSKKDGYKAACNALMTLMMQGKKQGDILEVEKVKGINFLGDFNLAGEMWLISNYLKKVGISIVSTFTGDASYEALLKAPSASLNIVQCAGSMTYLAKQMQKQFDIPFIRISFFGVEDTTESILKIANYIGDEEIIQNAEKFVVAIKEETENSLEYYRKRLHNRRAAIYVGGGFKAISLIKQFNDLGMKTVIVGTQTGKAEDYEEIYKLADEGTMILDDSNPYELEKFIKETGADILVGGVKERPLAYKLGLAFCDHNHERKHPLAGYEGAINFAKEIDESINSPIWSFLKEIENDSNYTEECLDIYNS